MARLRKKVMAYLEPEQDEALKALSEITRIPTAMRIREAVSDLIRKHDRTLKDAGFIYKPVFKLKRKPKRR